ncbi:MAG TPA: hypothetical protein VFB46_04035 [Gemmatimonadaceae bacterium]|nr:hypothetical protein [Gemmatimonadaceae bacterium]
MISCKQPGLSTIAPALLLALLLACDDGEPTAAVEAQPSLAANRAVGRGSLFVSCETTKTDAASTVIGADGGVLASGAAALLIPPQAVQTPTRFTMEPLPGGKLGVRIAARGATAFVFARPIAVMIGYAHCPRQELRPGKLTVWHVDDRTGTPLEEMPTVHDPRNAAVGFLTTHLSTYAVAH